PHLALSGKPGVSGEDSLEVAVLYQQHQRIFIQIFTPVAPVTIGMENTEAHAVEREMLSAGADMPGNCLTRELVEEGVIQRVCYRFARLDHNPGAVPFQDADNASQMVGMGVGNERQGKVTDAMAGKERYHHAAASIALVRLWSAVNQDPVTGRGSEQRTIALANVKKM